MSRLTSNRHLAAALLKTISALESDPSLDPQDPAFIHIKCTLLQRLLSLEVDTAEIKASVHLVESPGERRQVLAIETDEHAAIA